MAFDKTLLFVAISVTLSSCWIHSAGANPVLTEDDNQLDRVKFYWMIDSAYVQRYMRSSL
jgi:hypothetical protein